MWQSLEILNVFNTFTLQPIFSKMKTFFKNQGYCFLIESTRIENATFPHKTDQSEANVKTSRMGSTRWTNHKERRFASNYFIFSKNLLQVKNLVWKVHLKYQPPKCPCSYFSKVLEFYLRLLFPCEILNYFLNTPLDLLQSFFFCKSHIKTTVIGLFFLVKNVVYHN